MCGLSFSMEADFGPCSIAWIFIQIQAIVDKVCGIGKLRAL